MSVNLEEIQKLIKESELLRKDEAQLNLWMEKSKEMSPEQMDKLAQIFTQEKEEIKKANEEHERNLNKINDSYIDGLKGFARNWSSTMAQAEKDIKAQENAEDLLNNL